MSVGLLGSTHNSEDLADLHASRSLRVGVVDNVGLAVEEVVDTVAGVPADDRVALGLDNLLNLVANVAVGDAGLADGNGLLHGLLGRGDEVERLLVDVADGISSVQVAVEAVVDCSVRRALGRSNFKLTEGNVEVDNVAVLEGTLVRDTVADDLVDGRADRLGELCVVEGRGVAVALDAGLVADTVELVGGDADADMGRDEVEHLAGELDSQQSPEPVVVLTRQTFLMASISSLLQILTPRSRTASQADMPCANVSAWPPSQVHSRWSA